MMAFHPCWTVEKRVIDVNCRLLRRTLSCKVVTAYKAVEVTKIEMSTVTTSLPANYVASIVQ